MNNTPASPYQSAMERAIQLAQRGPATGINPRVGCVVLDPQGNPLAEGWHRGSGTAHAEVDALSKLTSEQAQGSTFVVTLEPCRHVGKTGPCVEALINAGVARVVYASSDPAENAGGGAQVLAHAGIEVVGGVCAGTAEQLNFEWLHAVRDHRPFVTVKWASSIDGRIAANDGSSQWITGPEARERVHLQRSLADAIAVGTGTVLSDNPALTARNTEGALLEHQPIPVIFGSRSIPENAAVYSHPHAPLLVQHHDLTLALTELFDSGFRRLYVEGGPTLITALMKANLVDRVYVFLAPTILGGDRAALGDIGVSTLSLRHDFTFEGIEQLGKDVLLTALPHRMEH